MSGLGTWIKEGMPGLGRTGSVATVLLSCLIGLSYGKLGHGLFAGTLVLFFAFMAQLPLLLLSDFLEKHLGENGFFILFKISYLSVAIFAVIIVTPLFVTSAKKATPPLKPGIYDVCTEGRFMEECEEFVVE